MLQTLNKITIYSKKKKITTVAYVHACVVCSYRGQPIG